MGYPGDSSSGRPRRRCNARILAAPPPAPDRPRWPAHAPVGRSRLPAVSGAGLRCRGDSVLMVMALEPILAAPLAVQLHFVTVVPAFVVGTWLLFFSRKGSPRHRLLGKVYLGLMATTALAALFIRSFSGPSVDVGPLRLGLLHLFVPLTAHGVYGALATIRAGNVAAIGRDARTVLRRPHHRGAAGVRARPGNVPDVLRLTRPAPQSAAGTLNESRQPPPSTADSSSAPPWARRSAWPRPAAARRAPGRMGRPRRIEEPGEGRGRDRTAVCVISTVRVVVSTRGASPTVTRLASPRVFDERTDRGQQRTDRGRQQPLVAEHLGGRGRQRRGRRAAGQPVLRERTPRPLRRTPLPDPLRPATVADRCAAPPPRRPSGGPRQPQRGRGMATRSRSGRPRSGTIAQRRLMDSSDVASVAITAGHDG